jgi:DUF2934 family protein
MAKESKPTTKAARKPAIRRRKVAEVAPVVTHDQIAERAYLLYVDGSEGDAFDHWVRAERELTAA